MKTMVCFKRIVGIVMMLFLLAACSGGDGGTVVTATPQMKITITSTTAYSGTYNGVAYDYEQLIGYIEGEIDPKNSKNASITDITLAKLDDRGMAAYKAGFVLMRPKDASKYNGVLRYDAPNRGNILTWPPDGTLLTRGYAILYGAWQGDVPASTAPAPPAVPRLTLTVPVAYNSDGSSITGPYRAELVPAQMMPTAAVSEIKLPGGVYNATMIPYASASSTLDNTGATLTYRIKETDPHIFIPNSDWKFARCGGSNPAFPGTADAGYVCLKGQFQPQYMYELVYTAKDPYVLGIGLAALRDYVYWFAHGTIDDFGHANPIAGKIKYTLGQGTSQCGNFMKTFLHLGFNQALNGNKVFDGILSHVAARQTQVNARFGVPGGGGGLRWDHTAFGQTAPRGLAKDYYDTVSGRTGGVMARCEATNTCPKFFLGLSGTEFWELQGSPVFTDAYGLADIAQPANARIYYYTSTMHYGNGAASGVGYTPTYSVYPSGTMTTFNDTFRALWIALEEWVVGGTEPPASQHPRISDGTLVRPNEWNTPITKGLAWPKKVGTNTCTTSADCAAPATCYNPNGRTGGGFCTAGESTAIPDFEYLGRYVDWALLDFGPRFIPQDDSGIADYLPPRYMGKDYAIMVPQVDRNGLAIAGIREVAVQAPIGTSLEFNYNAYEPWGNTLGLSGGYLPFHVGDTIDPRPAGETRQYLLKQNATDAEGLYLDKADYVAKVTAAANSLVAQRFLLRQDADRIIAEANNMTLLP